MTTTEEVTTKKPKRARTAIVDFAKQISQTSQIAGESETKARPRVGKPVINQDKLTLELPSGKKLRFIAKSVDPKLCKVWTGNNRDQKALNEENTAELRSRIKAQGQLVPALVRPIHDGSDYQYEVIYGSRRHFVCKQLDMPLSVIEADLDDRDALFFMDAENKAREDLSPYETALSYQAWLEQKLFKNQGEMADSLGLSGTWLSQLLALLKLPKELVEAFTELKDLSVLYGYELFKLQKNDAEAQERMIAKAKSLKGQQLPAHVVYEELLSAGKGDLTIPKATTVRRIRQESQSFSLMSKDDVEVAKVSNMANGVTRVTFSKRVPMKVIDKLMVELNKAISDLELAE